MLIKIHLLCINLTDLNNFFFQSFSWCSISGFFLSSEDILILQNNSSRRQKSLESLMEFLQAATQELIWLSEKEEIEVTRDWSSSRLDVPTVEEFYKVTIATHNLNLSKLLNLFPLSISIIGIIIPWSLEINCTFCNGKVVLLSDFFKWKKYFNYKR